MKKLFNVTMICSLFFVNLAVAQDSTKTSMKEAVSNSNAPLRTFGGAKQYSRFSLGLAAGALTPANILGGKNQYSTLNTQLGYSGFFKYQLNHAFGLRLDYLGGKFSANSTASTQNGAYTSGNNGGTDVTSALNYAISIKGEVDVAAINFLHRSDGLRFFVEGGYGLANFTPDTYGNSVNAGFIPVGGGFKIKLSNALAVNLGYEAMFFDANNLLGAPYPGPGAVQSKASYAYAGLELTFGTKHKPSMVWTNPAAVMYDELKANDSLAKEVTAVKNRVSAVEGDVSNLKKDSDGDGVSDVFDKCPNTPAGTKVDGAGCELPKPPAVVVQKTDTVVNDQDRAALKEALRNLQFETGKTVIKKTSYPYLDRCVAILNTKFSSKLSLKGYTDNLGKEAKNLELSQGRANAVKDYLVSKNINASRITAEGFGSANPVASNKTSRGRAKNRRVEFELN